MSTLQFDPRSLILPGKDVLHIINRRGTFVLRARRIEQLHQRLKPAIAEGCSETALLAAIPESHKDFVQKYLLKMQDAGGICTSEQIATVADTYHHEAWDIQQCQAALANGAENISCKVGERKVRIALDGIYDRLPDQDDCIIFAPSHAIGRELHRIGGPQKQQKRTTYVMSDNIGHSANTEHRQRAIIAKWLVGQIGRLPADGWTLQVFAAHDHGKLDRVLMEDLSSETGLNGLPLSLNLIHPAPVGQLPVLTFTASYWGSPYTVTAVGLHHDHLQRRLIDIFLGRIAFTHSGPMLLADRPMLNFDGRDHHDSPMPCDRIVDPSSMSFHSILLEMQAAALERFAAEQSGTCTAIADEKIDLLEAPHYSEEIYPEITYLRSVIRLRTSCLNGRKFNISNGLYVYEYEGQRCCSFVAAKALWTILLFAARRLYFPDINEPAIFLSPDYSNFMSPLRLSQMIWEWWERVASMHGSIRIRSSRIYCWNREIWGGQVDVV